VTPRTLILLGFAVLVLLMVVVDVRARRPSSTVRPFADAVGAVMRSRTGRIVLLGSWLWVGWHFLAR
jgi:hypothetical protein